jgi:hypothetical protein
MGNMFRPPSFLRKDDHVERAARYGGVAKTHVQHVAIAAAINIDRLVAWLDERPRAKTRTSRFAALAPVSALQPDEAAA